MMALNWTSVKAEHVAKACEVLQSGVHRPRAPAKGIVLLYQDSEFPAKHALRLAYCIANRMPLTAEIKFASGEGTIKLLRSLGFAAERKRGLTEVAGH
jgi:hypothetical protein